jgi:hypothetical protein
LFPVVPSMVLVLLEAFYCSVVALPVLVFCSNEVLFMAFCNMVVYLFTGAFLDHCRTLCIYRYDMDLS